MAESREDERGGTAPARKPRKTVVGTVRSDKMEKTITVDVIRLERHRKYHKFLRRSTRYHAHDEKSEAHVGDLVRIVETRPLSKTKRWRLIEVVRPAKRVEPIKEEEALEGGES